MICRDSLSFHPMHYDLGGFQHRSKIALTLSAKQEQALSAKQGQALRAKQEQALSAKHE